MASPERIKKILEGIEKWNKDRTLDGSINPSTLTVHDRRLCVQLLRVESNLSLTRMAIALGVSRRTIIRDVHYMNNASSMILDNAGTVELRNEFYQEYRIQKERAHAVGDKHLEWKMTCDFFQMLPMFGMLKPMSGGTNIHIGDNKIMNVGSVDETKALLDQMSQSKQKKLLSMIEESGILDDEKKAS